MNEAEEQFKDMEGKKMARLAVAKQMLDLSDDSDLPPDTGVVFGSKDEPEPPSKPPVGGFADPATAFGGSTSVGSQGRPKSA